MQSKDIKKYLKNICKNCKRTNGRCIINEPYIGLCAKVDEEELIELKRKEIKQ